MLQHPLRKEGARVFAIGISRCPGMLLHPVSNFESVTFPTLKPFFIFVGRIDLSFEHSNILLL